MQSKYKFIILQCRSIKTTCIKFKVLFAQIKYLSLRNVSQIFKPVMEIVQITSNTLFSFPIGTYNFHDDTAVVRNLQDVTNSSAHHNPRMTRIVQTIGFATQKYFQLMYNLMNTKVACYLDYPYLKKYQKNNSNQSNEKH